ncbi:sugar transporter SWEET1-like isoform X2 [Rhynchophorus ferrugineus]|uniref:sugar transporter SWEET1-like isoform X2 n=1 Tax=Rhynchophorus ferrugineus TaxID=354439 RepID=UPI003FCE3C77
MDSLSEYLQPYKGLVGEVASYVTILQFFSGCFVCKDIYNKHSTRGINPTPFIGGIALGILNLKYGLLLSDPAMIKVNIAAIFLNIVYSLFFYQFAEDKVIEVLKPLSFAFAIVAVILGYAGFENPDNLEFRFGFILTVLSLALLGAPLKDLRKIISNRDASSIPFSITFMATLVTFLWLIYGVILLNTFMIIQNTIGFLLSLTQVILIFLYPGRESSSNSSQNSS